MPGRLYLGRLPADGAGRDPGAQRVPAHPEYEVEGTPAMPLMIVGEGTNEIQRNVITVQLVAREKNGSI